MAKLLRKALAERTHYPWDKWLDGKPRELTHGEDFFIDARSFRKIIHVVVQRRNRARLKLNLDPIKVRTEITKDDKVRLQVSFPEKKPRPSRAKRNKELGVPNGSYTDGSRP